MAIFPYKESKCCLSDNNFITIIVLLNARASPIYEDVPKSKKELELIKEKVLSNELFHNILVLDDHRYTSILVELAVGDEQSNEKHIIYKKIEDILQQFKKNTNLL